MDPLVSIVVPVYNAQNFVTQTIESLLAQTYKHIEIIAIDDGSTDESYARLQPFQSRIKIIQQKNIGQAATLNKGWSMSSGEIIGYLSADDRIKPKCIEILVSKLVLMPEVGAVYPDYDLIDPEGKVLKKITAEEFDYNEVINNLVCPPGPGLLFRKKYFEKFGGWNSEYRQMPDFEYWLRIGQECKFTRIEQNLAEFRLHEESQTHSAPSQEKANEPIKIMFEFFNGLAPSANFNKLKSKSLASSYLLSAKLNLRAERWGVGIDQLLKSMSFDVTVLLRWRSVKMILSGMFGRLYYSFRLSAKSGVADQIDK